MLTPLEPPRKDKRSEKEEEEEDQEEEEEEEGEEPPSHLNLIGMRNISEMKMMMISWKKHVLEMIITF